MNSGRDIFIQPYCPPFDCSSFLYRPLNTSLSQNHISEELKWFPLSPLQVLTLTFFVKTLAFYKQVCHIVSARGVTSAG